MARERIFDGADGGADVGLAGFDFAQRFELAHALGERLALDPRLSTLDLRERFVALAGEGLDGFGQRVLVGEKFANAGHFALLELAALEQPAHFQDVPSHGRGELAQFRGQRLGFCLGKNSLSIVRFGRGFWFAFGGRCLLQISLAVFVGRRSSRRGGRIARCGRCWLFL